MGNCFASLQQPGMWDGTHWDGFRTGQTFISYYQVESVLLEYPRVLEAGVIAQSDSLRSHTLSVYLALEEDLGSEEEYLQFMDQVSGFIRQQFSLGCLICVKIREKLPMTRSGKILRTALQEWN